jgi:hypothetical protein
MNHFQHAAFTFASLGACMLACSSTPSTGTGTGGDSGSSVTFGEVYTTVLGPNCSSHHAAGQADSFLDMSTKSAAYDSLVGVKASGPACGSSAAVRVVPGSASTSLLYEKVSMTTPPCGSQMPLGLTPLSSADQQMIEAWINAGAQDD